MRRVAVAWEAAPASSSRRRLPRMHSTPAPLALPKHSRAHSRARALTHLNSLDLIHVQVTLHLAGAGADLEAPAGPATRLLHDEDALLLDAKDVLLRGLEGEAGRHVSAG